MPLLSEQQRQNKATILGELSALLGSDKVATQRKDTEHYLTGWRSGGGEALAVVFPVTLLACWQVLEICVRHNCIIIMQAANTGLTEGSTPSAEGYDRDIVVINTLGMDQLAVLGDGQQVISFAGTTLHQLEKRLAPLHRTPHSVIGSSCLGASVVGGIANNSGGALVKRGPAYTELSLFARVDEQGKLQLVNHLDIDLGDTPEAIFANLQNGDFDHSIHDTQRAASARDYPAIVRDIDANTPSRYNADANRLYEASGCAGKIAVFAVRLDTFAKAQNEQTFYIGTNHPDTLTALRLAILGTFTHLPDVAEYMHRDTFEVSRQYGKDTFLTVKHLGTDHLPKLFSVKGKLDAMLNKFSWLPPYVTDRAMQAISRVLPGHIPSRLLAFRDRFEHHLILKMSDEGIAEGREFLRQYFDTSPDQGDYFECIPLEAEAAYLNRFAAAGAAMRYQLIHADEVGEMLALDIALRRNDREWVEQLPEDIDRQIEKPLYYGHFLCHVFHQDYILKKGADASLVKNAMLARLDERGAKYPAEHNVGHLYEAEQTLKAFYTELDPTNTFNPGIGGMDKHQRNCSCCG